jgi:hypothetical protein
MAPSRQLQLHKERGAPCEGCAGSSGAHGWSSLSSQPRRRRRRLEPIRASTKVATASTQTHAAVEPAARRTTGFAVVSSKCKCKILNKAKCKHGRRKDVCKDCGTGYCQHGRRRKDACKDCGMGYCQHGPPKHTCRGCGTPGYCAPGARAPEAHVQGLRHGPLRARAPEGAVQGLLSSFLLGSPWPAYNAHWHSHGQWS